MDVAAFLDFVRQQPFYAGQLEHVEVLRERPGVFGEPAEPLSPQVAELLAARGIERLYSHQVAALELARRGRDLVVVTGTASGKTLCYNLPILEATLADPDARALYLFPTKALAQDQHKNLLELLTPGRTNETLQSGVFDGDTPVAQRRRIQAEAQLVLSNPDMLHASILPYHPKWSRYFSNLRYVVVDEIHTYRGILGANVACVLRRLARVCEHYGSRPVMLAASATIANPGELAGKLLGREVAVVDGDGAPRGRKYFALWNPAPLGEDRLARRSTADDAVLLMVEAMLAGAQALTFTRTRQAAELVHRYVREELEARHSKLAAQVRAYRGGYLPLERRQIEAELFEGNLRGVAPPTRWSWVSILARWTWRFSPAIRARSPAPGSKRAAAVGGTTTVWRCCWRATIRSISIWRAIQSISSRSRPSMRSLIRRIPTCWPITCNRRRSSCRWRK